MKMIGMIVMFCAVLSGCTEVVSDAPSQNAAPEDKKIVSADKTVYKKSIAELEKEIKTLKSENRRLRRELVRQREGEPSIKLPTKVRERKGVAGEETNGKATDDGGYWLATEKQRRHNSKCKYYKLGKGRPCEKDEGTPCKRCGG